MTHHTVKTTTDCDFLVYLGNDLRPVGYELTLSERKEFAKLYNTMETDLEPNIPEKAVYILEVFAVSTTIVWLMGDDKKGELLFYKPSMLKLAKAIVDTFDAAIEILEYEPEKESEKETLPAKVDTIKEIREEHQKEVIARLPFENWMAIYWMTPMWGKVWRARPDLQDTMAAFTIKHSQGDIIVNKDGEVK